MLLGCVSSKGGIMLPNHIEQRSQHPLLPISISFCYRLWPNTVWRKLLLIEGYVWQQDLAPCNTARRGKIAQFLVAWFSWLLPCWLQVAQHVQKTHQQSSLQHQGQAVIKIDELFKVLFRGTVKNASAMLSAISEAIMAAERATFGRGIAQPQYN